MPDDVKDLLAEDHRSDILKQLDEFNTAPEFGMQGILQEQLQQQHPDITPSPTAEEDPEKPPVKEPDYEKAYAPLNSSIQELGYRMDARVADLENQLRQQQAPQQQQQQVPQYDPDAPVTMAQLMALHSEVQGTNRQAQQAEMRSEYLRAHLEYERFKQRNPDFVTTPQELDASFNRLLSGDLNKARNTNWTGLFAQVHEQTAGPRMKNEIMELKKQLEELTKKASKGSSTTAPENRISPATSSSPAATTRATILSPAQNLGTSDVVNMKSFKKGKTFKSFAGDLKRHYGITNQVS